MYHFHKCKAMWGTLHNCSPTFHRCNSRFTICSIEWEKTLLCFPSSYPVHTSLLLPIPPTPLTHSPPPHPVAHFTPTWPIRHITKEASRVVFSFLLQRKRISNCQSLPPSFYTKSHSSNNSSSINNDDNLCNTFLFLPFLSPFASLLSVTYVPILS